MARSRRLGIDELCRKLRVAQGETRRPQGLPPLDELIVTILSQSTTDANCEAAFQSLRGRFPDWDSVRVARVASIERAIREAGLSRLKAPRIKRILQSIHTRHGRMSLDFLRDMPSHEAAAYLQRFSGVGPKTAACVLLFACDMPVLPVDTHVHRVSRRLGLIGANTRADKAHEELSALVRPELVLEFHLRLIGHGRTICTARRPRCPDCVLRTHCPEGRAHKP